jgi:hypothetical protein
MRTIFNKKAKKSIRPRASTGNTHHGMRFVSDKLFIVTNIGILFFENNMAPMQGKIDQLVYQLYGLTEEEIKIVEGTTI